MQKNLAFFVFMASCSLWAADDSGLNRDASGEAMVVGGASMRSGDSGVRKEGVVSQSCGGVSFSIRKTGDASAMLSRLEANGRAAEIAVPAEMQGYQPVALGCAVSKQDGKPYFVVQYGELPAGCAFCEWLYIYDALGNSLSNRAVIFKGESSGSASRRYPNNAEYQQVLKKMALDHPEMGYLQ